MRQPEADDDLQWDDAVDVICVGAGAGPLAYGIACAAADLEVIHVAAPPEFDADTAAYLAAMTEDLTGTPAEEEPAVTRAAPAPRHRDARGRPDVLEPFVGEHLRVFSAHCLVSPSGVMFTHVPEILTRMRTADGGTITAVQVEGPGAETEMVEVFAGLVYQDGVLVGAVLDGAAGRRGVRADAGLAFGLGDPALPWPAGANALVSRPAGRFARLEHLVVTDD